MQVTYLVGTFRPRQEPLGEAFKPEASENGRTTGTGGVLHLGDGVRKEGNEGLEAFQLAHTLFIILLFPTGHRRRIDPLHR